MTADLARSMWTLFEPVHAVAYFAPGPRDGFERAGVRGFWRAYFAGRAAPLGRTGPHQVHAAFQSFTFEMVARALPTVWDLIEPTEAWRIRTETCGAAVEESTDGIERELIVIAAAALRALVERLDPVGRPFFAHLDLAWPDDPHASLWHACTLLREHRGDGYVSACVAHDVSGLDMMLLAERSGKVPEGHAATNRGWSADAITERAEALRSDACSTPRERRPRRRANFASASRAEPTTSPARGGRAPDERDASDHRCALHRRERHRPARLAHLPQPRRRRATQRASRPPRRAPATLIRGSRRSGDRRSTSARGESEPKRVRTG